jgi:hypothetical protein
VIKTLAIFENYCALNSKEVLAAIRQSTAKFGIQVLSNSMDADALLIWSVLWNGRMLPNKSLYDHYRQQGKPVIVIDVGALKRNVTWKVSVNNVNALGQYGHLENLDFDRPKKLGLQLSSNKSNGEIIVMGQHAKSLAFMPWICQENWFNHTVEILRQHTDRQIVLRPHPRSRINPHLLTQSARLQIPKQIAGTYDDFDASFNYHLVVNYNSGPGIQAAIHGANVFVDVTSLAAPIGIKVNQLETPPSTDRERWLIEIAHTEYTVPELANGTWLTRLEKWIS